MSVRPDVDAANRGMLMVALCMWLVPSSVAEYVVVVAVDRYLAASFVAVFEECVAEMD